MSGTTHRFFHPQGLDRVAANYRATVSRGGIGAEEMERRMALINGVTELDAVGSAVDGFAAFTGDGRGVVHVLVAEDALPRLRKALDDAGMAIADEREVLVVNVSDEPGALGEVSRTLADANVNVDLAYTTFGGVRVVFGTDDMHSARAVLDG